MTYEKHYENTKKSKFFKWIYSKTVKDTLREKIKEKGKKEKKYWLLNKKQYQRDTKETPANHRRPETIKGNSGDISCDLGYTRKIWTV